MKTYLTYLTCLNSIKNLLRDTWDIFFAVSKIMVPLLILLKIAEPFGLINIVAQWLEPVMIYLGLPGYTAIVWVTAMTGNVYASLATLSALWQQHPLSVAQVSVLSLIILVAHNLLVECAVAHKSGGNGIFLFLWRIISGFIMGWLAWTFLNYFQLLQQPAHLYIETVSLDLPFSEWILKQTKLLLQMFVIIAIMIIFLKILKKTHLEKKLHNAIEPLLKLFGLNHNAANITIIGMILGISYGAGFLIREVQQKKVSRREGALVMTILSVNHAVIEDSLLMLITGASIWIVLLFRLVVGLPLSWIVCQFINLFPQASWLFITQESAKARINPK